MYVSFNMKNGIIMNTDEIFKCLHVCDCSCTCIAYIYLYAYICIHVQENNSRHASNQTNPLEFTMYLVIDYIYIYIYTCTYS
jgi:hypothetical protein